MIGAFAQPDVERDVELGVHRFEGTAAHFHEVFPELAVFLVAVLELGELCPRPFGEGLVVVCPFRGKLVHPLELGDRLRLQGALVAPFAHSNDHSNPN